MNAWCVTAILGGSHPKSKTLPETNSFPSWEWMVGGFKDFQLQPDRSLGKLHPFDGEKIDKSRVGSTTNKAYEQPTKDVFPFFFSPTRERVFLLVNVRKLGMAIFGGNFPNGGFDGCLILSLLPSDCAVFGSGSNWYRRSKASLRLAPETNLGTFGMLGWRQLVKRWFFGVSPEKCGETLPCFSNIIYFKSNLKRVLPAIFFLGGMIIRKQNKCP